MRQAEEEGEEFRGWEGGLRLDIADLNAGLGGLLIL